MDGQTNRRAGFTRNAASWGGPHNKQVSSLYVRQANLKAISDLSRTNRYKPCSGTRTEEKYS